LDRGSLVISSTRRFRMEMERRSENLAFQGIRGEGASRPGTLVNLPYYAKRNYNLGYPKVFIQQRGQISPEPVSVDVINASYLITHHSSITPLRFHAFHHILRSALYDKFNHKKEAYTDAKSVLSADVVRMVEEGFEPILRTATTFTSDPDKRKEELINLLLAVVAFCRRMEELGRPFCYGDFIPCPRECRKDMVAEILRFEREPVVQEL